MRQEYSGFEKKLLDFAQGVPSISAIARGNNPEDEGMITYWMIVSAPYDRDRSDAITALELAQGNFFLAEWPSADVKSYPFLGKVIWRR